MFAKTRKAWLATATALAIVGFGAGAGAQDRVQWKLQSAFPSNLSHIGTSGMRHMMCTIPGGIRVEFVPGAKIFDYHGAVEEAKANPSDLLKRVKELLERP